MQGTKTSNLRIRSPAPLRAPARKTRTKLKRIKVRSTFSKYSRMTTLSLELLTGPSDFMTPNTGSSLGLKISM